MIEQTTSGPQSIQFNATDFSDIAVRSPKCVWVVCFGFKSLLATTDNNCNDTRFYIWFSDPRNACEPFQILIIKLIN